MESGLECACVNNDDFTVLVSWGGKCCWVSMYTVWLWHSLWLSKESNESASKFALSLNIPSQKLYGWFRRLLLWAAGDGQLDNMPAHASRFVEFIGGTSNYPGDSAPLQPRFGALWLLAFPKTEITFEREKTSDLRWDSGKHDGAPDSDWQNCVRLQGAYYEGGWGFIALCTYNISCVLYLLQ